MLQVSSFLRRSAGLSLGACSAVLLSGCLALAPGPKETPRPAIRPVEPIYTPSVAAQELTKYYADLEQDLLTRGLLRTDGGGPDIPYDAENLAERFEALAFYDEYASAADAGYGALGRWQQPVRLVPLFGPQSAPPKRPRTVQPSPPMLTGCNGSPAIRSPSDPRATLP